MTGFYFQVLVTFLTSEGSERVQLRREDKTCPSGHVITNILFNVLICIEDVVRFKAETRVKQGFGLHA